MLVPKTNLGGPRRLTTLGHCNKPTRLPEP
jgi:hypothetical protein